MTSKNGKSDFLELVKSDRRAIPKPPRLLAAIQQQLQDSCERLLEQLFAAADDVLYDLSKRANNNSEENLYFESMREVRIAKPGLVRHFLQNISMNFSHLVGDRNLPAHESLQSVGPQGLAIMDGDELEVDLALKGMTSRGRDMYREPLYELVMRLDHLLLQVDIRDTNNPLDPHQIAYAFVEACSDTLDIDIKARLIVFKLFEKHLLRQLTPVYETANQLLLDAGILPKVPRRLTAGAGPADTAASPAEQPADSASTATPSQSSAGEERQTPSLNFKMSVETLVSLLNGVSHKASAPGASTVMCYVTTAANPGPLMASETLASLLTRAQVLADRQLTKGPKNIVPEMVRMLICKADADKPQKLEQRDESIINLVSLFFDEVLADQNLPLPIFALICRLQIPLLKVALRERDLFSSPEHPARALVNTISEIGMGFDDSDSLEREPVYRKMVDAVHTLSREPKADGEAFAEQHRQLNALIQRESRKVALVEKRTSQSATGRAKIRSAKTKSQNLLYSKLNGVQLPYEVADFLTTAWLQVLIITQLKHGFDSAEWLAAGSTADDLIWLCQRHEDVRSLQRREVLQPLVMQRIQGELEAAIESAAVRQAKVGELENVLEQISIYPDDVDYQSLSAQHRTALGREAMADANNDSASRDGTPSAAQTIAQRYLDQVDALNEGGWIEYEDEPGHKCRYKLATKVTPHTYVFVNRKGFKTLERTAQELARDLAEGRARLVNAEVFFDRLMNKVLSQIQEAA